MGINKAPKANKNAGQAGQKKGKAKKIKNAFTLDWINFDNDLVIAVLVIIGSIIWFNIFKGLIQYLPSWLHLLLLFVSTYVVAGFVSKAVKDSERKKRKLIKWLPILLVFIFNFLPSLDQASFDSEGKTLEWINIENGTTYHRPVYEIHEDSKGKYFFDPKTGDTCRRATDHWRGVYRENNQIEERSVYITKYDTLVDKVYSLSDANAKGIIHTHVYGYDVNKLDKPEVVIINLKGSDESSVVVAKVKSGTKIYASYRQPVAKYRYPNKITKKLHLSMPLVIKGDAKVRVLLLNKKRVKKISSLIKGNRQRHSLFFFFMLI